MSGYQVQSQSFFVNLNPASNVDAQLNLLNTSVMKFQQVLYATGPIAGEDLIGKLITFTGVVGATTVSLPSTADVLEAIYLANETAIGNQIQNIPATQRETLLAPTIGTTWTLMIKNDSASTVTLSNSDLTYQGATTVTTGQLAVFNLVITGPTTVAMNRA